MSGRGNRRRCLRIGVASATALFAIAGCGSSSSSPAATASTPGTKTPETLNVSLPLQAISYLALYVAENKGYFQDENLIVNISIDPTLLTQMVAGQTDITIASAVGGATAAIKGEGVQEVFGWQYDAGEALITNAKYSSISQLQSLNSCRLGSLAPGTQVYAYAAHFKQLFGLKCDIIVAASYPLLASGLNSGSYDAAVMAGFVAAQTIAGGGTHILVDPLQSDFQSKYALPKALTASVLGLASHLKSDPEPLTRFLRAIVRAQATMQTMSPDDLAVLMQKQQPETFGSLSVDNLKLQIKYAWESITQTGYISSSVWASCLKSYDSWQVQGFSSSQPAVAYGKVVDMSYYKNAGGKTA